MAEDQDPAQKTEEPTQKRVEDSRRKGQVATSREVNHWFMILGASLLVTMLAPGMFGRIKATLVEFIASPHDVTLDPGTVHAITVDLIGDLGSIMAVPAAILMALAVFGGLIQNGPIFAPELIKPKLEKISLLKGVKRLFSGRSLMEFTKGVLKLAIVATVATMVVVPEFDRLTQLPGYHISQLLAFLWELSGRVLIAVLAVMTVVAGLDMLYQKFEHGKKQRMSRQEIRDELKQTEGDPLIRARLRQIRMERARKRMMSAVPDAAVVITNPTHYAVALKYEHEDMEAPVLVAKGADKMAERIRDVAEENEVPIVENAPLARALYAGVEIDQEIPPEHYRVVAEIIGYVMRLSGRHGGPRS